jgi:hypothetical protein
MDPKTYPRLAQGFHARFPISKYLTAVSDDGDGLQDSHIADLRVLRDNCVLGSAVKRQEHAAIDGNRHQYGKAEASETGSAG